MPSDVLNQVLTFKSLVKKFDFKNGKITFQSSGLRLLFH